MSEAAQKPSKDEIPVEKKPEISAEQKAEMEK